MLGPCGLDRLVATGHHRNGIFAIPVAPRWSAPYTTGTLPGSPVRFRPSARRRGWVIRPASWEHDDRLR
jgi:hypothetical protein